MSNVRVLRSAPSPGIDTAAGEGPEAFEAPAEAAEPVVPGEVATANGLVGALTVTVNSAPLTPAAAASARDLMTADTSRECPEGPEPANPANPVDPVGCAPDGNVSVSGVRFPT